MLASCTKLFDGENGGRSFGRKKNYGLTVTVSSKPGAPPGVSYPPVYGRCAGRFRHPSSLADRPKTVDVVPLQHKRTTWDTMHLGKVG